jgi:hypothetical protein
LLCVPGLSLGACVRACVRALVGGWGRAQLWHHAVSDPYECLQLSVEELLR